MPVAEGPSKLLRGQKTLCIPCSQQQYEQVVDDREQFRRLLDHQIETTPELFPPELCRGYRMKDVYTYQSDRAPGSCVDRRDGVAQGRGPTGED